METKTLDKISDNSYHVDNTKSISNEDLQQLNNQSVNTCTTARSTNIKSEDLVSSTLETSIKTEAFHFPTDNLIYFDSNDIDWFFKTSKISDKPSLKYSKILEKKGLLYYQPTLFVDVEVDDTKTVFSID